MPGESGHLASVTGKARESSVAHHITLIHGVHHLQTLARGPYRCQLPLLLIRFLISSPGRGAVSCWAVSALLSRPLDKKYFCCCSPGFPFINTSVCSFTGCGEMSCNRRRYNLSSSPFVGGGVMWGDGKGCRRERLLVGGGGGGRNWQITLEYNTGLSLSFCHCRFSRRLRTGVGDITFMSNQTKIKNYF